MEGAPCTRGNREIRIVLAASRTSSLRSLAANPGCDGFTLCAVENSAERAIIATIALEPDIFLLVSDLPSWPLAVAAWITRAAPGVKIIVVVENVDEEEWLAFLMAGASA